MSAILPQQTAIDCFHCGQPVPPEAAAALRWPVLIDGAQHPMCCAGCQAVARAIIDLGQADYYRTRSSFAVTADVQALVPPQLVLYDEDRQQFARADNTCEATLTVEGIRCAACVWLIEKRLMRLPGVLAANLNVATERLQVRWNEAECKPSAIFAALREVGYAAYPYDTTRHGEQLRRASRALSRRLFVAGLSMMQVMMYVAPAYLADDGTLDAPMEQLMRWASLLLTLPAVCYSAQPFFQGAWSGLRARMPGMDLPVALGIGAAFYASVLATMRAQGQVYFDSVTMFVFLLLCSRYLELAARRKAAFALERLQHALPASAERMAQFPASRECVTIAVAQLACGDVIAVKPGQAIAADSVVLEGDSALDLSLLTGESAPQRVAPGQSAPGGAVNVGALLVLRVTKAARESTLADLLKLINRAGHAKPRIAQWADQLASRFVLMLLLFALLVFGYWYQADPARAWEIAIAVLVVSCPCALSLAMPTALAAATDLLLRRGVLVVRSHVLETLHRATHIVFDKTGTLTVGKPVLQGVDVLGTANRDECLGLAVALESASAHPLARAFADAAGAQDAPSALGVTEAPGLGLEGRVGGQLYRIGNLAYVQGIAGSLRAPTRDDSASDDGASAVFLGSKDQWLARFVIADALRADARDVVCYFQDAGKTVLLVSGDADQVAQDIGRQLGVDSAQGDALPAQKLDMVQALQRAGAVVAMVGDGINDAAVLGAADVSFAMGCGAPLAQIHADAVLLSGRLSSLSDTAATARATMSVIRQNLCWAMLYNVVAIPAAALGLITPWLSGVGMAASSALVVANAWRLRRARAR